MSQKSSYDEGCRVAHRRFTDERKEAPKVRHSRWDRVGIGLCVALVLSLAVLVHPGSVGPYHSHGDEEVSLASAVDADAWLGQYHQLLNLAETVTLGDGSSADVPEHGYPQSLNTSVDGAQQEGIRYRRFAVTLKVMPLRGERDNKAGRYNVLICPGPDRV